MKNLVLLSVLLLCSVISYAQSPGINYQAVLRNAEGLPIANENISLTIQISDASDGTILLSEIHDLTTNALGLINTMIGSGMNMEGGIENLKGVPNLDYNLRASIAGGEEIPLGSGAIGAVPYAYYGEDADADPENELQELILDGDSLKISGMGGVSLEKIASPWKKDQDTLQYGLVDVLPDSIVIGGNSTFRNANGASTTVGCGEVKVKGINNDMIITPLGLLAISKESNSRIEYLNEFNDNSGVSTFNLAHRIKLLELSEEFESFKRTVTPTSTTTINTAGPNSNRIFASTGLYKDPLDGLTAIGLNPLDVRFAKHGISDELSNFRLLSNGVLSFTSSSEIEHKKDVELYPVIGTGTADLSLFRLQRLNNWNSSTSISGLGSKQIDEISNGTNIKKTTFSGNRGVLEDMDFIPMDIDEMNDELSMTGVNTELEYIDGLKSSQSFTKDENLTLNEISIEGKPVIRNGFDKVNNTTFFEGLFDGTFLFGGSGAENTSGLRNADFGGNLATGSENGLKTLIGALPGVDPDVPYVILFNGLNFGVVHSVNNEFNGQSSTYNSNGQRVTISGNFSGDEGGSHITYASDGTLGAYMRTLNDGTSEVSADNFIMTTQAPPQSGTDQYMALAPAISPEPVAYDRGTARLVNGEAEIVLSEYFNWIADASSMTVTITPLSADSKGIAVIDKSDGSFRVKELHGGQGNYEFDFMVMCRRKGQESYQLIRQNPDIAKGEDFELQRNLPKGKIGSIKDLNQSSK